jgi:hypothetical protein
MRFLIERADKREVFDEVDAEVFANRQFAVLDDGNPRYTDNYATEDAGGYRFHFVGASVRLLSIIMRVFSVPAAPSGVPGGWLEEPEMIGFVKGRSRYYYHVPTGDKYLRKAAA